MGDWLGTGNISNRYKVYRPFKEAREFVRKLNLKSQQKWQEYCKSGNKPDDIPRNAHTTYKKEWKGVGDWLGTGRTRNHRSYKDAREFVQSLGLKGVKEWQEYCKSDEKPKDIPQDVAHIYKKRIQGNG